MKFFGTVTSTKKVSGKLLYQFEVVRMENRKMANINMEI